MGKELDIDDVAAGHPMAQAYLSGMRAETERLRAENSTFRNAKLACEQKLGAKDVPRQKFALKPRAVEAGCITSLDLDGTNHEVPMGLLIQFESAAHLRQAIDDGRLEFSFLE